MSFFHGVSVGTALIDVPDESCRKLNWLGSLHSVARRMVSTDTFKIDHGKWARRMGIVFGGHGSTKGILMWSLRRLLGIGVIASGLAVGPATGLLPHASASPTVNTFQIPLFVTNSIWACGFQIFCLSNPVAITGETPGTVTFPAMSPEAKGAC